MLRILIIGCLLSVASQTTGNELYWLTEPSLDVGLLADNEAEDLRISNTGRYISFVSKANNLVMNDLNQGFTNRNHPTGVGNPKWGAGQRGPHFCFFTSLI